MSLIGLIGTTAATQVGHTMAKQATDLGADSMMPTMRRIKDAAILAGGDNYVSKSQPAIVQPITLIDARCANIPFTDDVLATALNTIIAYYLMSIAMDDTINNISVTKRLESMNPDRSVINASRDLMTMRGIKGALENAVKKSEAPIDINSIVKEVTNMAVGKIVNVKLRADHLSYTVPVKFTLQPMPVPSSVLAEMIDVSSYDGSVANRWLKVRTGEIRFVKDFIFAADRMDAYFKTAIKDSSGFFEETQKRAAKGLAAAALSGSHSTGVNSNILLISTATIKDFERNTLRSFDDIRVRNEFFANTNAILVMVLDNDWEQVTVFTRGISKGATYSAKSLRSAAKNGNGDDIMSILKAYEAGKAPGRY